MDRECIPPKQVSQSPNICSFHIATTTRRSNWSPKGIQNSLTVALPSEKRRPILVGTWIKRSYICRALAAGSDANCIKNFPWRHWDWNSTRVHKLVKYHDNMKHALIWHGSVNTLNISKHSKNIPIFFPSSLVQSRTPWVLVAQGETLPCLQTT